MAAEDPILLGLAGATFLMTVEAGGKVQSYSETTESSEIFVYGADVGYDVGAVIHNPVKSFDWSSICVLVSAALAGLCAASPGVALTIANATAFNGVASGGIYTKSVKRSHSAGQLLTYSGTAWQRYGIS